jgi:chorismate mutase
MPIDVDRKASSSGGRVLCRGVRGATTAERDTEEAILRATGELLASLVKSNGIEPSEVASVLFTVTPDLTAAFPARAARDLGWKHVPLLDAQEMPVPGSLPRCVRVMIHWNTDRSQTEIRHIYLRGAALLRPDLERERGEP